MAYDDSKLAALADFGQSVWLDFISRDLLRSGRLDALVARGVSGMTTNPTIFQKAIDQGDAYDDDIAELAEQGRSPAEIADALIVSDVRAACDLLRPVYDRTAHRDGYVSIEVSPEVAYDTRASLREARRLHEAVGWPNVMVKIPGTPPAIAAIRQAVAAGLHINITLLFAVDTYQQVIDAFQGGLEERVARGEPIDDVHSVASFFVSRIDAKADREIDERLAGERDAVVRERLEGLRGTLALVNARLAYARFNESLASDRWHRLAERGAHAQRLLWASTSTKDPRYDDLLYVDNLIGRRTVDTMPQETLDAFLDHGVVRRTLGNDAGDEARGHVERAAALGIDLRTITGELQAEGVRLFSDSFEGLRDTVERKRAELLAGEERRLSA
jgi:transaldolase